MPHAQGSKMTDRMHCSSALSSQQAYLRSEETLVAHIKPPLSVSPGVARVQRDNLNLCRCGAHDGAVKTIII
jgi:hypothetical protein